MRFLNFGRRPALSAASLLTLFAWVFGTIPSPLTPIVVPAVYAQEAPQSDAPVPVSPLGETPLQSEEAAPANGGPSAAEAVPEPEATPEPVEPAGEETAANQGDTLPHNLSPWGMFMAADIVVKAVMIGLVIASIVTWTVFLAKSLELSAARGKARRALGLIAKERSLAGSARRLGKARGVVPAFVDAARTELKLSQGGADAAGIKERVESRLDGLRVAAVRQMNAGTGVLATIGSTAPFVGLFGTVWGIMNSFIGISKAQTTNLAVVAPGIAEALLATALGLVAAIPAVIVYNYFARSIAGYRALVSDAAAEVMRQLSRDLDAAPSAAKPEIQAAAE